MLFVSFKGIQVLADGMIFDKCIHILFIFLCFIVLGAFRWTSSTADDHGKATYLHLRFLVDSVFSARVILVISR